MSRILIPFIALALVLTGCISKKKYAALEAELNTLRTKQEINEVSETAEQKTADEYEKILEGMELEMNDMYKRMEMAMQSYEAASGKAFDPAEAQKILEERHVDETPAPTDEQAPMMKELHQQETQMRFTKKAFDKVAQNYTGSQMQVQQVGGKLVISIQRSVLFTGDDTELSAGGETALNRLAAAFAVKNQFRVLVMGVSESGTDKQQLMRAYEVVLGMNQRAETAGRLMIPSSIPCASSYVKFKTCDRIDIVLEQDYEAAVGTLRYEPKY